MMYPDYQKVDDPEVRARFAKAWGVPPAQLDDKPGLTVVEVIQASPTARSRACTSWARIPR